jgi:hypothetical protein
MATIATARRSAMANPESEGMISSAFWSTAFSMIRASKPGSSPQNGVVNSSDPK